MSSALQNRLVGTIILVAIAVIFLPDLLDGKKESNRDLFVDVPQRPKPKAVISTDEFPTDNVVQQSSRQIEIVEATPVDDPVESGSQTSEPGEEASTEVTPEAPSLEQDTIVEQDPERLLASAGWVVQLGVFRHEANVKELLKKLKDAGYRAFSQPIQTSSGRLTKVYVGPDLQKERLEKAVPHLKELTNLQGRITPFTVK